MENCQELVTIAAGNNEMGFLTATLKRMCAKGKIGLKLDPSRFLCHETAEFGLEEFGGFGSVNKRIKRRRILT